MVGLVTDELPDSLIDHTAPPGTPMGVHATAVSAPVYCWHPQDDGSWEAVRWERRPGGWYADDQLLEHHPGHKDPARDPGVIVAICGLVSAHNNPRGGPHPRIRAWGETQGQRPEGEMPDPT